MATAKHADRTLISTDGWNAYPRAVDLAFANTVDYGIIIKDFTESEQPGRYGPPVLSGTIRRPVTKGLDPFDICTSHVERHNLTIRTFMRRFTRRATFLDDVVEDMEHELPCVPAEESPANVSSA